MLAENSASFQVIFEKEAFYVHVIPYITQEPLGGAHTDPTWTSQQIKVKLVKAMQVHFVLQFCLFLT